MNARRPLLFTSALALLLAATSCGPQQAAPASPAPAAMVTPPDAAVAVTIVESPPLETTLDHTDVPNAADVWRTMIDGAKRTIDLGEFYASDDALHQSKLTPVVEAIERAMARGVRVRFLADSVFAPKYPDTLARLRRGGATVRIIDVSKTAGGIMHAKYFVIDGRDTFLGSQNFDWRSLDHVFEIGLRVASPAFARDVLDVFETDWALAGGANTKTRVTSAGRVTSLEAAGGRLSFVASPKEWLPDEGSWDLPRMVTMIDDAARSVDVEVLTYKTKFRDGKPFPTLDDALRRAAARGVHVRLLVSDWATKPGGDGRVDLESIARVPNVEVRIVVIPRWSGGDVPYARVAHAKYMVVDGAKHAWVGTSNWEGDYFTKTRNVGAILDGGSVPGALDAIFESVWGSAYSQPISASAAASPPSSTGPARP